VNNKNTKTILLVVFGTPILGFLIGELGSLKAHDESGLGGAFGLVVGILAVVVSLIVGVIVSFLTRSSLDQKYAKAAYLIPAGLALLYILAMSLTA